MIPKFPQQMAGIGIGSFSHIIVIFEMNQSTWDSAIDMVRRPQGPADMPPVGIFAQRAL
jgi:tRNA (Thr-GGU) A37 N-methylase